VLAVLPIADPGLRSVCGDVADTPKHIEAAMLDASHRFADYDRGPAMAMAMTACFNGDGQSDRVLPNMVRSELIPVAAIDRRNEHSA
jgi:hypothetical protein